MNPWWFGVPAGVLSLVVSYFGWRTSQDNIRNSYRPVLRPVPWLVGAALQMVTDRVLVKNIGNGPALAVVLYVENTGQVLATLDVVEKLGAHTPTPSDPGRRVGREFLYIVNGQLALQTMHALAYQDLGGHWHLTQFRPRAQNHRVWHRGPQRWWMWFTGPWIPHTVKQHAQVVPGEGP